MAETTHITVDADTSGALAALGEWTRAVAAASDPAARLARSYRQAFDQIGAGWRSAVTGLVEGTISFQTAAGRVVRSVERGFVDLAATTLSHAAAGPLAALLGVGTPGVGQGVGDVLGSALAGTLFGAPQQLGAAAAATASTAALAANTAALGALTAALGATAGANALGGAAALGTAAEGGGIFGFLGSLFAFAGGGIVPSAAGGWALPSFAGSRPALLHAREMVLPAPISQGLQNIIAQGGGSDMHLHFHGPADGPAVERWFIGLMARNPGVIRDMLRSNALTPRTL